MCCAYARLLGARRTPAALQQHMAVYVASLVALFGFMAVSAYLLYRVHVWMKRNTNLIEPPPQKWRVLLGKYGYYPAAAIGLVASPSIFLVMLWCRGYQYRPRGLRAAITLTMAIQSVVKFALNAAFIGVNDSPDTSSIISLVVGLANAVYSSWRVRYGPAVGLLSRALSRRCCGAVRAGTPKA